MEKKKFGAYIKEQRLKKGYTQKELASLLFVDVSAVSKWERGITYPDITLISPLCKYLEVSEKELIDSSNDTEYRKMQRDAKTYNRIKDVFFYGTSISYMVAILTCFIVNVAVNHTLSWFFLVLFSCLTGYVFMPTVLRFIPSKFKLWGFVGSTYLAMLSLFVCCSVYVRNYWFAIAGAGVFLGYWTVFFPILFYKNNFFLPENKFGKVKKWFAPIYLVGMYASICALLLCIRLYHAYPLGKGLLIATIACLILFFVAAATRLRTNAWIKVGICVVSIIPYWAILDLALYGIFGGGSTGETKPVYMVNFNDWANYVNGNVRLIGYLVCLAVGLLLVGVGIFFAVKKRKKGQKTA